MMASVWIDSEDGEDTADPENQLQWDASLSNGEFFHGRESTKKVPAGKCASNRLISGYLKIFA